MARRWLPSVLWALLIEALMLWPNPPAVPQAWTTLVLFDFVRPDKLVHAILFAVMSVLLLRALAAEARPWWIALLSSAALGACTEVQQHFVPTRSMAFGDFLADAAGAAVGFAIFSAWALRRREFIR